MARIVADSPELARLARGAGHTVVADHAATPALKDAEAVLLEGEDAWERLRGWRIGRVRAGAVILTMDAPPTDRPRLEPVVLLRTAERDALSQAIERLFDGRPAGTLDLALGRVDLDRCVFRTWDGEERGLTTQEARLLGYLGARPGRAISREELQLQVWDHYRPIPTRGVDMAVSRLRRKLGDPPRRPRTLVTVRHDGYRLVLGRERGRGAGGLVGRDALLARLERTLAGSGLLVLSGPPGVGKSSLARVLVDGGLRVDLDGVRDLSTAVSRLAQAARVRLPDRTPPQEALDHVVRELGIRGTRTLLDHVDGIPPLLHALPGGAPFVATTRVVRDPPDRATVRRVPPLDPDAAAELLTLRAREAGRPLEAAAARELAPHLDGLPLALELAAGRLGTLGVDGLRAWMDARLDVLGGGEGRHASLRVALEGAWQDLAPDEQDLLARLTAFRAPFAVDAARAVAPWASVDAWSALVGAGLVARAGDQFQLLHAVRDHARDALPDAARDADEAHGAWLLGRVRVALDRVGRAGGLDAFEALGARRSELEALVVRPGLADPDRMDAVRGLDVVLWSWGTEDERLAWYDRVRPLLTTDAARGGLLHLEGVTRANRERRRALGLLDEAVALLAGDADAAARTALEGARAARWIEGPRGAEARASRFLDAPGVRPETGLRLRARVLLSAMELERVGLREGTLEMLGMVDQLEVLGALEDAVRVAFMLPNRIRLLGLGDPVELVRRAASWARELPSPASRGQAAVSLGIELGAAGDLDGALQAFAEADEVFGRAEPARRLQVLQQRAIAQYHCGELDAGEQGLERYVAWCTQQANALGQADGLLFLASLACERGASAVALERAQRALAASRAAENAHLVHHALLVEGLAHLLAGDVPRAVAVLESVEPALLSAIGQHAWRARLAGARRLCGARDVALEAEILRAAQKEPGTFGASVRAVTEAGLSADRPALEALAHDRGPMASEVRLLAQVWLLAVSSC